MINAKCTGNYSTKVNNEKMSCVSIIFIISICFALSWNGFSELVEFCMDNFK